MSHTEEIVPPPVSTSANKRVRRARKIAIFVILLYALLYLLFCKSGEDTFIKRNNLRNEGEVEAFITSSLPPQEVTVDDVLNFIKQQEISHCSEPRSSTAQLKAELPDITFDSSLHCIIPITDFHNTDICGFGVLHCMYNRLFSFNLELQFFFYEGTFQALRLSKWGVILFAPRNRDDIYSLV